jgi:hypothetical protein
VSLHACDFKIWFNCESSSHVMRVCHCDIFCVNVDVSGCDVRSQAQARIHVTWLAHLLQIASFGMLLVSCQGTIRASHRMSQAVGPMGAKLW